MISSTPKGILRLPLAYEIGSHAGVNFPERKLDHSPFILFLRLLFSYNTNADELVFSWKMQSSGSVRYVWKIPLDCW